MNTLVQPPPPPPATSTDLNREEKSLRHVAMVSKFLDDNKPEKWIRIVSNFIDLIPFHLVCQMLTKFSGVESDRMVSNF